MALPARAHPPNLSFEQLPLPATNGYSVHTDCSSDPDDSSTEPEQDEQLDSPSFELSSSRPERHGFAELHSEAYLRELESTFPLLVLSLRLTLMFHNRCMVSLLD